KITTDGYNGLFLGGGTTGNLIGGTAPGSRNLISGNAFAGLRAFSDFSATAPNRILGNYIGTDITGLLPRGNGGAGVVLSSSNVQIGGVGPGEGNVISNNGGYGVAVVAQSGLATVSNAILSNSIYSNGGLGIDLAGDGITANDSTPSPDADSGPNK